MKRTLAGSRSPVSATTGLAGNKQADPVSSSTSWPTGGVRKLPTPSAIATGNGMWGQFMGPDVVIYQKALAYRKLGIELSEIKALFPSRTPVHVQAPRYTGY